MSDAIEALGLNTQVLPHEMFTVKLDTGQRVLGHLSGKMRKFNIKIVLGDRVTLELSPYDLTKGRIVRRG